MREQDGFYGVYMTDKGRIILNRDAKVDDLLFVIGKLADEVKFWRDKALPRPVPGRLQSTR